jgi:serine phosphatase RsbU (regulator of sigma subunit)
MLREVIDIASLEDFASGLARAARLRVCMYDRGGQLIVASPADNDFALLTRHVLDRLPPHIDLVPVPAHDPPASVAFVESEAVWYIVAPVYTEDHHVAGYVGIGEFRDRPPASEQWQTPAASRGVNRQVLTQAWEKLPPLDRRGHSHGVVTARWGARRLAEWSRRESRLLVATDQVALVGDIAELLTGEQDLRKVLHRIVAETARVMDCPFCSMRLYDPKSDALTIQAVHNLPPDYIGKRAVLRATSPVDDDALRGGIVYVEDAGRDPRVQHPDEFRQHGLVSVLAAGMIYRGQPVGVIRVYTRRRRRFRKVQRDLLRAVAYQAATAIVHAQLVEERLRTTEMQRQLALAGELQERMIRIPPPRHARLETALAFHPTYAVAGDFCDFLTLCDGRLLALVADVAGKGVPASLLMSSVRGALRAAAEYCAGPSELLTGLNLQLCRETLPSEFVTLLLITINQEARRLTYVNAGHEPLLLLRDGQLHALEEGNLVLGIDPGERYEEHTLALEPNDLLLLYTDGAIEARNFADEEFTRERLWDSLRAYGQLRLPQVLHNIVWDIRRFVGLAEQSDDLTLVGVRIRPEDGQ